MGEMFDEVKVRLVQMRIVVEMFIIVILDGIIIVKIIKIIDEVVCKESRQLIINKIFIVKGKKVLEFLK